MSTIQEFENAPVGATATGPNGLTALKTGRGSFEWSVYFSYGGYCDNRPSEQMVDFTLNPTPPTTAREALDLAWILGCPVKEGQVIPEGTRYLEFHGDELGEYIATGNIKISPGLVLVIRTVDPLPDPEPDWLDAPAVKARVRGYPVLFTWVPVDGPRHHRWYSPVKGQGETYDWQNLCDVTPLYPEGTKNDR